MAPLSWIVLGGVVMMAVSLVGGVTVFLRSSWVRRLVLPLVALSAGSMLGGAFFHMLPAALQAQRSHEFTFGWAMVGFVTFLALEQLLHWHHCHHSETGCYHPLSYLVLLGDGLHNFLGGIAVAGTFLVDIRLGVTTWLAAAAHEIPQELGDFGVLLHAGWSPRRALAWNLISASTFLLGGVLAYLVNLHLDLSFLVPFAAGNFIYIGASDLVPAINRHERARNNLLHLLTFSVAALLLFLLKLTLE